MDKVERRGRNRGGEMLGKINEKQKRKIKRQRERERRGVRGCQTM